MHCSAVNYGYWDRSFSGSQKKIGLDVFQDGDSDAKMDYKVCHASFFQVGASFGWVLSAYVFLAPIEEVSCLILTVPWKLEKVK